MVNWRLLEKCADISRRWKGAGASHRMGPDSGPCRSWTELGLFLACWFYEHAGPDGPCFTRRSGTMARHRLCAAFCVKRSEIAKRTQIQKCINLYASKTNEKNPKFILKKRTHSYDSGHHRGKGESFSKIRFAAFVGGRVPNGLRVLPDRKATEGYGRTPGEPH
jgi:hypothetical protein